MQTSANRRPTNRDPLATLPTELPEFVKPFQSPWHRLQIEWLIESVSVRWADLSGFHCDGHVPVYYAANPDRSAIGCVPDFFALKSVERKPRKCWVAWDEEGRRPDLAIELLDENIDRMELREKVRVYEKIFRVGEYYFFDRRGNEVLGFRFGHTYSRIATEPSGRVWSHHLEAWLGPWTGEYGGMNSTWLRFFDTPTP